jgi:hypothetical protein
MRGGEFWGARRPAQFRSPTTQHIPRSNNMSFVTQEMVREIRLASATDLEIDGIKGVKFKLVKLSAEAGEQLTAKQKELTDGKISPVELARFCLRHAVATPEGDPLTDEDAAALIGVLPLESVLNLVAAFTGGVKQQIAASTEKRAATKKAKGS